MKQRCINIVQNKTVCGTLYVQKLHLIVLPCDTKCVFVGVFFFFKFISRFFPRYYFSYPFCSNNNKQSISLCWKTAFANYVNNKMLFKSKHFTSVQKLWVLQSGQHREILLLIKYKSATKRLRSFPWQCNFTYFSNYTLHMQCTTLGSLATLSQSSSNKRCCHGDRLVRIPR